MLRDVLASLPDVSTWPCDEINYIWRHGNAAHPHDELLPRHATPKVRSYVQTAFAKLGRRESVRWIVEKTCANSLRVPFVDRILPDAKYVFLIRDGRDAVVSAMRRWSAKLDLPYVLKKARYVPPSDIGRYALRYFRHRVQRLRSQDRCLPTWGPQFVGMEHWLSEGSLAEVCAAQWACCVTKARDDLSRIAEHRRVCMRYEEFVARPDAALTQLLEFLHVPASTTRISDAVRDVMPSRVGRWRSALDEERLQRIAKIINEPLAECGYTPIATARAAAHGQREAA